MSLLLLPFSLLLLVYAQNNGAVTDYAPQTNIECPDITNTPFIRQWTPQNQTLNPREEEYVNTRLKTVVKDAWHDWLGDGSALGYNITLFNNTFPKVGIAIPGGGLRAAQFGAASLNALDARNDTAKAAGTGGLLQVASYITGLSGGSWITGSLVFNNFPKLNDLVFGNGQDLSGWLLDLRFATPDGIDLFSQNNQYFFGSLLWSVQSKANKGIDTSLTDPWARMISYHFLNQTTRDNFFTNNSGHGAGQLWSHIPNLPAFQQYQMPIPIAVSDSRPGNSTYTTTLPLDPVVYEMTPFEFASYDPNLSAGMNMSYTGMHLTNGRPDNGSSCVTGFDQAGFIMGSSASLFNQILDFAHNKLTDFSAADGSALLYVLSRQLSSVRTRADDVANWPNPFNGIKPETFADSDQTWLNLIDGASNGENVPYGPLFVNKRSLDVIVTLDGSADTANNFPNGTSPLFTSKRLKTLLQSSHQQFPPIPADSSDFLSTGVTLRPTFFGCNPKDQPEYPLVIYLPSSPPFNGDDPVGNTATFQLSYTLKASRLMFDQTFKNQISGFVPNTNDADPNFGKCLQCAAIDRARLRQTPIVPRSDFCTKCFTQYCYDPANPPSANELPRRKLAFIDPDPTGFSQVTGFLGKSKFKLIGGLVGLVVLIALMVFGLCWWKKRRERKQYRAVNAFHDDSDVNTPLKQYSDFVRPQSSYELPTFKGDSAANRDA